MLAILTLFIIGVLLCAFLVFYGYRFPTISKAIIAAYGVLIVLYAIYLSDIPDDTAHMLYSLIIVGGVAAFAEEYFSQKHTNGRN